MDDFVQVSILAVVVVAFVLLGLLMHAGGLHSIQIETGRPPVADEPLRFLYAFAMGESGKQRKLKRLLEEVEKTKVKNVQLIIVHYDERDKIKAERRRFAVGFIEPIPTDSELQDETNGSSVTAASSLPKQQTDRFLRSSVIASDSAELDSVRTRKKNVSATLSANTKFSSGHPPRGSRKAGAVPQFDSKTIASKLRLRIADWPPISNSVFCEFPYRSRFSIALADRLVPTRVSAYTANRRLSAYPLLEIRPICSGLFSRLLYVAPLAKQDAFFVEEAVIRKR